MLDDPDALRASRAIPTGGCLSAAARRLGVTLAVVGRRPATPEGRAGVRLIHRATWALSSTEDGARLLIDVQRALDAVEAGEGLAGGRDEPVGTSRMSAPLAFGRRRLAPTAGELVRRHPRLAVSLDLDGRVADLAGKGLDVAVRIGGLAHGSATVRKLADDRRIPVAAPACPDAAGRPSAPERAAARAMARWLGEPMPAEAPHGRVIVTAAPEIVHPRPERD